MPDETPVTEETAKPRFEILVVDDEPALREIISQILEGYQVTTAPNGAEAVQLMNQSSFEMVITDLMMPQADGFTVLVTAKTLNPSTDVLVLTGYPSEENESKARALGCVDILSKPFAVAAIRSKVEECLRQRQAATPPT